MKQTELEITETELTGIDASSSRALRKQQQVEEIRRLAKENGWSDEQINAMINKSQGADINTKLDNVIGFLKGIKDASQVLGGTLTDEKGNPLNKPVEKPDDTKPDLKIMGMSPLAFGVVATGVVILAGWGLYRFFKK